MIWKLFGLGESKNPKKEELPARDVEALVKPLSVAAVGLRTTNAPSKSHFLGMPNVRDGFAWPTRGDKRLDFLASINLAELHLVFEFDWLPKLGNLLFFYDIENQPWGFDPKDRGSWAVILVADDQMRDDSAHIERKLGQVDPWPVRSNIGFYKKDSLPSWERPTVAQLKLSNTESVLYNALFERSFGDQPKHQMSGFPAPVQGDHMELECQLVSNGLYCGDASGYQSERARQLESGASEWRLLLQLDTDDHLNVMWGDCGTLYFFIRESDARRGDFSNVWLISQCC